MNFWERVDELLDRKGINKKTLAYEADFDPSNITKGIKNGNIPSAETAVKIAQTLHVSVEYLVTGKHAVNDSDFTSPKTLLFAHDFDGLSERDKRIVLALVREMKHGQG